VAAGAGVAAVWLTREGGQIECARFDVGEPTLIPGWVFIASAPALITGLVGGYFALGLERVVLRLAALIVTLALAAGVFYGVFLYLPAGCRP
jgi:hypothetical protein